MTSLLRFRDVGLRRGGRLLFEGLSFALGPGDALHVAGPNGCGKSSLLRLAAGLLRAERGDVDAAPAALADDALSLDPERTLERALRFWGGEIEQGMEALGLADLRSVPVRLLSAGQARRAALARVAASPAPLWLLDEPANGLDEQSVKRLSEAVVRHRSSGGAVVAASHTALAGDWRTLELGQ